MEIKNFTITKRDGSKDQFSLDKIMNAIVKAFDSVNCPADLGTISKILSHLDIHDDITVETIQNQVEEALMREGFYQVDDVPLRIHRIGECCNRFQIRCKCQCGAQEHRNADW